MDISIIVPNGSSGVELTHEAGRDVVLLQGDSTCVVWNYERLTDLVNALNIVRAQLAGR